MATACLQRTLRSALFVCVLLRDFVPRCGRFVGAVCRSAHNTKQCSFLEPGFARRQRDQLASDQTGVLIRLQTSPGATAYSREGRDAAEGLARQPGDCPRRLASRRRQVVRIQRTWFWHPFGCRRRLRACSRKSAFAQTTRLQLRNDGVRHGSSVLAMPRTNLQSQAERFAPESCSKPGRPSGL